MNDPSVFYHIIGAVLLILLVLCDWYLLKDKTALRDISSGAVKSYSLSRVQLWWWTNVVIAGLLLAYMMTGRIPTLNHTCLVLLGIGIGTTAAGRIIDGHDQAVIGAARRHQNGASEGFMTDILSDDNGVSIHRFQTLAFNLIYGVDFLVQVFNAARVSGGVAAFPHYTESTLALLLGSAAGYLAVKTRENASPTSSAAAPAAPEAQTPPADPKPD